MSGDLSKRVFSYPFQSIPFRYTYKKGEKVYFFYPKVAERGGGRSEPFHFVICLTKAKKSLFCILKGLKGGGGSELSGHVPYKVEFLLTPSLCSSKNIR